MSTIHGMRRKKGAELLRTEEDGTEVWRYRHQTLRVAPGHGGQPGQYSPFPSREAFYRATGGKDQRPTTWMAEAVRERRQQTKEHYRAVMPGPQRADV